jgi:phosphoribosyl 1,2-cyclic phosphodiesterase
MTAEAVFRITYWGMTGTLPAPLRPPQVTEKIVEALCLLAQRGRLGQLQPGPGLEAAARRLVEEELPFALRAGYGGNTTCVEVQTPDALLILDCGSGFRELGNALEARWRHAPPGPARTAHVLVTHPHGDHTFATPYFSPYFDASNSFTVWGSREVLDSLAVLFDPASSLSRIFFPPTYDHMTALRELREITPADEFSIGSTRVRTKALRHPGGCLAFRLDCAGRSFVFATDHEQAEVPDRGLAAFAHGADLLYTEGQYTLAEYEGREGLCGAAGQSRRGWGHSPAESCVRTAVAAEVRELHIGHRDPQRDDAGLAQLEAVLHGQLQSELAAAGLPGDHCRVRIPYEGLQVSL